MGLLLALLGLVVAGDVVELEPVKAGPTNVYHCDDWSAVVNQTVCQNSPYCRWYGGGATPKCYDDPCLKLMTAGSTCSTISLDNGDVVSCQQISNLGTKWTDADCGDNQEVLDVCVQVPISGTYEANIYNYCFYAQLRDGTCPLSVCREYDPGSLNTLSKHCLRNERVGCEILSTSEECGLVPKCYWKSNSLGCQPDPCYTLEEDITGTCASYHPIADATATCTEFKPYKKNGGGSVATYCVISANSKPNLCYLGTPGTDYNSLFNDYGDTYPTLNISETTGSLLAKPTCATTGTDCDNMGDCVLTVNKKGGLAGAYCTDGKHGAASNLRTPSLFAVLLVVLFAILNF